MIHDQKKPKNLLQLNSKGFAQSAFTPQWEEWWWKLNHRKHNQKGSWPEQNRHRFTRRYEEEECCPFPPLPFTMAFLVSSYFTWQRSRGTSLLVPLNSSALLLSPTLPDPSLRKTTTSHALRQTDRHRWCWMTLPLTCHIHDPFHKQALSFLKAGPSISF